MNAWEDAQEDEASEETLSALKEQMEEAKQASRQAGDTVNQMIQHLADIEAECPDLLGHIHIALPRPLLPIWQPGRSLAHFDDLELLESPSRNRVFRATYNGKVCAVKEFPASKENIKPCFREASLLRRMQHPAIVQIEAIFFEEPGGGMPGRFCIQMPFYENGPINEWVREHRPDARSVGLAMLGVLHGLAHLHDHGVVHADIKPTNILIDAAGRPRLADFDVSVDTAVSWLTRFHRTHAGGTHGFMAPEVPITGPSSQSDIYAFGETLKLVTTTVGSVAALQPLHCPELIEELMQVEAARRPTAREAANHPYFVEFSRWRREEWRRCSICLEDHSLELGLECPRNDQHFLCDECLQGHVQTEVGKDLYFKEAHGGRVLCPGCPHREQAYFDDSCLAWRLPRNIFEAYLNVRIELKEKELQQKMEAEMREHVRREKDLLVELGVREYKIEQAATRAIDNILTLRCPECKQAFYDFEGCFALKCSRCGCGFCGWCLYSAGADAHDHVRQCSKKPPGADLFFGTKDQFEEAQRRRRQATLTKYVSELPGDIKIGVRDRIRRDAQALGLDV